VNLAQRLVGTHAAPSTDRVDRVTDEVLPAAIPAATVVLLRDAPDGVETLMLRRNSKLAFAGGAWVFPGGRIDPEDYPNGPPAADEPSTGDPEATVAARNAAVREAQEEAGLAVDPDSLVWFAHWTPGPIAPRRFATWFFMARAPEGRVMIDDGEIHEHLWIRPSEAISRRDAGEIELIPPTWMTLRMLADEPSVDAALATARGHDPNIYVTHIVSVDGGIASIWQGDAAYEDGDALKPGPRNRLLMLEDGWRVEIS
jgi:8-oxo-dGTP pyrophosphatase MutT (NUDIX family)